MSEIFKSLNVTSGQDSQKQTVAAKEASTVAPDGDFRHLLQNQVSGREHSGAVAASPPGMTDAQGMPRLEVHDRSLAIGRVILTGGAKTAADSQLHQFMHDHGFLEGGMANYMKQTMLGASAAMTDSLADELTSALPAALEMAQSAEPIAPGPLSQNPLAPTLQESFASSGTKAPSSPVTEPLMPAPTEVMIEETLTATSTKEILAAQWSLVSEDNKQIAAAQAAAQESGVLDVDFSNQQQMGQRSGQGEQSPNFAQNNPATNEEAQSKAQQYRDWSERFSELLGARMAMAVQEGRWSVQLDLDAMDLGSVAIQLSSAEDGVRGLVTSTDPAVRQLLAESLPKLQAALEAALGNHIDSPAVSLSLGAAQQQPADGFETIILSAEELAQALPADFKAGDGLNVFV